MLSRSFASPRQTSKGKNTTHSFLWYFYQMSPFIPWIPPAIRRILSSWHRPSLCNFEMISKLISRKLLSRCFYHSRKYCSEFWSEIRALQSHPLFDQKHPSIYFVWDFVKRAEYMLSEYDNILNARPLQHPHQFRPPQQGKYFPRCHFAPFYLSEALVVWLQSLLTLAIWLWN